MAVLCSEVVDAVLAATDSDVGPELVAGWCSERYRELSNRSRMRHLTRFSELIMPAVINAGTVTVTSGSNTIVGDATARAAWLAIGQDAMVDRFFRVDGQRNWFHITGINGVGDILLETHYVIPFVNSALSITGAGYKVVQ